MPLQINYTVGYAGTGKSHSLLKLVESLPHNDFVVIAPTHKALNRLRGGLPEDTEIKTIHSLLGWIPTINENAKKVEHIDSTHKLDKPLAKYSHIIIDEFSMMNEDMFTEIITKLETMLWDEENERELDKTIVLDLFGDPYQLLPVKGFPIQTDPETTTILTKQYRSESPDIVALFTKFVNYLDGSNTTDLTTPYSENVRPLDINKFKRGDRLLAYTNEAVGKWNKLIAKKLGINSYVGQEVQLGSMTDTVLVTKFVKPKLRELVMWLDTGALKLQNSQMSKQFIESSLKALIDNEYIEFIEAMNGFIYPVIVGTHKANIVLKNAKKKAIENKKHFKEVYALGRAFTMDYSFATTVHKSQGSEWDTIFVDKKDIQKSIMGGTSGGPAYYETYARLMYVSISRSKKLLYI